MALSNRFSQVSLYGGGSTPEWKRLGYSSQAEYINALTGADGKKKIPTTLEEAYGSSSAIHLSPQDRLGNFDQDVVAKVWNGSGSGGVTDEGVVIGNPNVEKFPTIKNSSSGKTSTDTLASMKETTPTATGGGSVPAATGGGSPAGTGGSEGIEATGSNEFGAKYQGNDFLKWYKANYGTDYDPSQGFSRGQGMSDVDWAIGNSLYGTYLTGQTLDKYYNLGKEQVEQNYGQSIESLDTSRRNSQQAASITLDKLKKYLPTQIKAQGLGGLGVSESSMLQAYTDYNNRMGDIESDYNATKSTLEANRNATLADLESNYLQETGDLQTGALKNTQDIFNQYLTDYKEEQRELYNNALSAVMNSGYTTEQEILSYIDQFKGQLSSENIATLQQHAKGIASQNLKAQQEENFNTAYEYYAGAGWTDAAALESYFNQFKGKVSDEDWATLQALVNDVKNSPEEQARQEAIKEQQELEEFNSITRGDVAFNNNGGWWIFGATDYRDGDNFSVKDGDGFIYRIQSGGEVADSNIANAARDVSNREVFGYGGKLYYKENGKIYLVEKRDNSYGDHYDKLYKRFFG